MQPDEKGLPEKAALLVKLAEAQFNVPFFLYMPPEDFAQERFEALEEFLGEYCAGYKVIVRSCHPQEERYKGGTFDSLETYADVGGVKYARTRIMKTVMDEKRLSLKRQQRFSHAPRIDVEQTGVLVMPFVEGTNVMAKMIGDHWEFGYCRDRTHKFQGEPYITQTPHDLGLLQVSEEVQSCLGFRCEIEYIISPDGQIHVVQAKDISKVETLELKESERSLNLDGMRRIRKRRNYRERCIYVMDNRSLYLELISDCEDLVHGCVGPEKRFEDIIERIKDFENDMEAFALRHERFGVLGLSIEVPEQLYQVANHYLDDTPELQKRLSTTLYRNLYKVDQFLAEADTLIARDKFRRNLCSHDAYGINTVRTPIWSVYWAAGRHKEVVEAFRALDFKTGDYVGIEVDEREKPTVIRL